MDERTKESISALMDDEANELEVQRILSKADSKEVLDAWAGYHRVRDVMTGMRDSRLDIDISKGVASAVGDSPEQSSDEAQTSAPLKTSATVTSLDTAAEGGNRMAWLKYGGGAVAACLMVVLASSFNVQTSSGVAEQTVASSQNDEEPQLVVNRIDASQASRVNEYLLRHAERSSVSLASTMTPLVRVASVNSIGI